jgi:hypothetical protein
MAGLNLKTDYTVIDKRFRVMENIPDKSLKNSPVRLVAVNYELGVGAAA